MRPHQPEDSHNEWTLSKISQANFLSFVVESRADEDVICNFGIISQIRNSGLFGNLELMKTYLKSHYGYFTVNGCIMKGIIILPLSSQTSKFDAIQPPLS